MILAGSCLDPVQRHNIAQAHDSGVKVAQSIFPAIFPGHRQTGRLVRDEVIGEHLRGRFPVSIPRGGIEPVNEVDHILRCHHTFPN